MLIDLILDLIWLVRHENATVWVAGAHFRLRALESGEELGVDEGGFWVLQFHGDITGQPEIGILVDSTWDQAGNVCSCSKDLRKRVRERRCSLDSCEMDLANIIPELMRLYGTSRIAILLTTL